MDCSKQQEREHQAPFSGHSQAGHSQDSFKDLDSALQHATTLRSHLRLFALCSEQIGTIDAADREELLLSLLEDADCVHKYLYRLLPSTSG